MFTRSVVIRDLDAVTMSTNFNRGDTGIHTVEGNLAGHKAARLTKKREKDQQEFEAKKLKMQADAQKGTGAIDDKFKSSTHNAFGVRTRRLVPGVAASGD